VLVVRLDATLIEADSDKDGAAGTYKGGYGWIRRYQVVCVNTSMEVSTDDGCRGIK
jgi:hypothetical protein